jgi:hypothetical protein
MTIGCTGSCMWYWDGTKYTGCTASNCSAGCGCGNNPPPFHPPQGYTGWVPYICVPTSGTLASSAKPAKFSCLIYHHKKYKPRLKQHSEKPAKKKAPPQKKAPSKKAAPRNQAK